MARPSKSPEEMRIKSVNIALTEAEYNQLQAWAGHGDRVVRETSKRPMPTRTKSIAGIIRQQLFKTKRQEVGEDERKALFQLAGMARNLNQLAAQANAQGFGSVATRTNELADQIREIISRYDRKS